MKTTTFPLKYAHSVVIKEFDNKLVRKSENKIFGTFCHETHTNKRHKT